MWVLASLIRGLLSAGFDLKSRFIRPLTLAYLRHLTQNWSSEYEGSCASPLHSMMLKHPQSGLSQK